MPAIRERAKADGAWFFHVQVRMAGFPARTASFPTRRQAERWAKTVEAQMIQGKHFRSDQRWRQYLADNFDVPVSQLPVVLSHVRKSGRTGLPRHGNQASPQWVNHSHLGVLRDQT
jgi:hypothetical protein